MLMKLKMSPLVFLVVVLVSRDLVRGRRRRTDLADPRKRRSGPGHVAESRSSLQGLRVGYPIDLLSFQLLIVC